MERLETLNDQMRFATEGNQYPSFSLAQKEYGVEILKVQEIRGYSTVTPVPNTPGYIKGVMNLRGTIIPVVDLRSKLSLEQADYNQITVIIVVAVGTKVVGMIVDSVSDVLNIASSDVQAAPDFGTAVDGSYIKGMAKAADNLIVLLDIDKLLGGAGLETMAENN